MPPPKDKGLHSGSKLDPKLRFVIDEVKRRFNVRIRPIDRKKFMADVLIFLDIYNRSLEGTWGFVPMTEKEVEHKAMERFKILEIDQLAAKKANQLSGGEKQRVAIARALVNDPAIIIGDEPTGNLDKKNTEIVFDIFKQLSQEFQQTLLIVTHDQSFAANTNRIIEMEDGKIIRQ